MTLTLAFYTYQSTALAQGPDPVSCHPIDPRVKVPANFALDACFDGSTLLIINRSSLPAFVHLSGDLTYKNQSRFAGTSSWASTLFDPLGRMLLVPGFQMFVSVGKGTGTASVSFDSDVSRRYAEATIVAGQAPSLAALPEVFAAYLPEMDTDYVDLVRCEQGAHSVFSKAGCGAGFMWDATFAVGRLAVNTALSIIEVKQALQLLIQAAKSANDSSSIAKDLPKLQHASLSINIPALPSVGARNTGPSTTGRGSGGSTDVGAPVRGSTPGGISTVSLAQGPTAPKGFRYSVTLSGFPANKVVAVTCFDSVSRSGFYTFSITTDSAGHATTQSQCYSGDGPDHWIRADGVESNHVTWRAVSQPPTPVTTYSETTGSTSNTFTDYSNAGGQTGPQIGSNQTLQVSCKVSGFKVADGDTWWYRVASSPWSNTYYVNDGPNLTP